MRIINLTLFTILLFGSINYSYSQGQRNRQYALITFNYTVNPIIKNSFNEFSHLFPEIENKRADKIIAKIKDHSWFLIEERLEAETGMYILPLNSHGRSFKYDVYGFPEVTINKALRDGNSKYYLRVDLTINAISTRGETGYGVRPQQKDTARTFEDIPSNAVIPQVTIIATLYNDKGIIPMQRITGTALVNAPWVVTEETLDGIINKNEYNPNDTNTLMGLINLAITDLINKF
jgi:hypothetical protein